LALHFQFSEPHGAMTIGPEPQLVAATWDDEAFREYFAEHGYEADGE
jgi:hypothetical protein